MERLYRLISLRHCNCSGCNGDLHTPESIIIGEYANRVELEEAIEARRHKGFVLLVDFLIDGRWYRGTTTSRDPVAWE